MSNRTSTSASNANDQVTYFDLITTGVGYLNRIRDIHPEDGPSYTCCKINALVGPSNKVAYREFDLKVVGQQAFEALDIIAQAMSHKDAKVIVTFRVGDAKPGSYEFQRDDGRGNLRTETRYKNQGRLLQITSATIDGQRIELPQIEHADEAVNPGQGDDQGYDDNFESDHMDSPQQAEPVRDARPQQRAPQPAQQQRQPSQRQQPSQQSAPQARQPVRQQRRAA